MRWTARWSGRLMLATDRRGEVVILPAGARLALAGFTSGASLDSIRSYRELDLFAVRLPPRDRRHHQLRRLVHAVRLRSF